MPFKFADSIAENFIEGMPPDEFAKRCKWGFNAVVNSCIISQPDRKSKLAISGNTLLLELSKGLTEIFADPRNEHLAATFHDPVSEMIINHIIEQGLKDNLKENNMLRLALTHIIGSGKRVSRNITEFLSDTEIPGSDSVILEADVRLAMRVEPVPIETLQRGLAFAKEWVMDVPPGIASQEQDAVIKKAQNLVNEFVERYGALIDGIARGLKPPPPRLSDMRESEPPSEELGR